MFLTDQSAPWHLILDTQFVKYFSFMSVFISTPAVVAGNTKLYTLWKLRPNVYHFVYPVGVLILLCVICCATNRKVASSIPDGVIGIFH